jgi:autotransporter translocation and assembly factor TamB
MTAKIEIDETDTHSTIDVRSQRQKLVAVTGRIPVSIRDLEANPKGVLEAPLAVTATIPDVSAPAVLTTFGRTEIIAGTIAGTIDVTGTVGKPTAKAHITGTNLQVPPGAGGKPVKTLERLVIDGSWDGERAKLAIDGTQQNGSLRLTAAVVPTKLAEANVELTAKEFDLIPLLVFAPGPAGGAAGRLDANVRVTGLDPQTMKLAGEIHLVNARVPIAPTVGTLRRAKIDIVAGKDLKIGVDGMLGSGTLSMRGAFNLVGAMPQNGEAKLTLRKVSPIGVVEPKVDADIQAKLFREDDHWVTNIAIRNGHIVVPKGRGEKLDPVGAPTDMRFAVTGERITERPMEKQPPARPKLVANVRIYNCFVESQELRGLIKGKVQITTDGQNVGITGDILTDRGDLDLFGHRYQVERAAVHFDGTPDPRLDILITHDFPDVTTRTLVRGRLSKPELIMTSDPPNYSQTQLLGFLLGGEPGGEPGNARDRATSAGASYVANKIGGYVKSALPIDLDVLRYEAATSQSSAAVTAGTWLTRDLFLAFRRRLESRPDENSNEGEIEYWISKRVRIEGVAGDRGYNGVDLLWRKRY